ncbi:MAG TPA: ABC transporter substrate-binding protein [Chloroflexota bacterium]
MRGEAKTISAKLNSAAGAGGTPGVAETERILNAGLAVIDDAQALHAQLSEALPSTDNGLWKVFPDGRMETTWHLHEGILWHDGVPFSTEDLLFTLRVAQDRELPIFRDVAYQYMGSIAAPDARTVTISWKEPFIQADTMFSGERALPMPKHLLEKVYTEDKENLPNLSYWSRDFVGTGPFKLQDWVTGSHLVLAANDHFVLGRPKIDEAQVRFIPDPGTMGAAILANEIDVTEGGRLALDWGVALQDQWKNGRMVIGNPTSAIGVWPQFLNPNPAILLDPQFRRALLYATDRRELIDSLTFGLGPIYESTISPKDAEYTDVEGAIVRYEFDTRKSAQFIEGLGYTKASDGLYHDAQGQVLAVASQTQITDDQQVKTQLSVANYWQQIGVKVDQITFPSQQAQDREFRATRPAFEVTRQPQGWKELRRFYGPNTPLPANDYTGINRTRHQNPEFDGLIDRFFTTVPRAQRIDVLRQIVHYMTDQVIILGMFYDVGPTMVSNRLYNTDGDVYNAHEWDVR